MLTRRDFIKGMAWLGGIVLYPFGWLDKSSSPPEAGSKAEGELYAGFLLLPAGASVPAFVRYPQLGIPNVCGVGVSANESSPHAVTRSFDEAENLVRKIDFPLYTLRLPENLRPGKPYILGYETGQVFGVSLGFETYHSEADCWECVTSIWAQREFPRPFPLWPGDQVDGPGTVLEKVDFLPSPGVRLGTGEGCVYYWIANDVFYTLAVESASAVGQEAQFVGSLTLLQ